MFATTADGVQNCRNGMYPYPVNNIKDVHQKILKRLSNLNRIHLTSPIPDFLGAEQSTPKELFSYMRQAFLPGKSDIFVAGDSYFQLGFFMGEKNADGSVTYGGTWDGGSTAGLFNDGMVKPSEIFLNQGPGGLPILDIILRAAAGAKRSDIKADGSYTGPQPKYSVNQAQGIMGNEHFNSSASDFLTIGQDYNGLNNKVVGLTFYEIKSQSAGQYGPTLGNINYSCGSSSQPPAIGVKPCFPPQPSSQSVIILGPYQDVTEK